MDHQVRLFRVFIASPSDLGDERRCAREVVEELNAIFSKETDLRIELLGWEDTLPGSGRPQSLINADLDKADLFIGCLWQKMGSPAGPTGKTGFEEEFERALARNKADGSPEMWLFLKEIDSVRAADPGEQLRRVLEFKKEQEVAKHLLFKEFRDVGSWRDLLHSLLLRRLLQAITSRPTGTKDEQSSGIAPSQNAVLNTETPKADSKKGDIAFSSLADHLGLAADKVRSQQLLAFDKNGALPAEVSARFCCSQLQTTTGTHSILNLAPTKSTRSIFIERMPLLQDRSVCLFCALFSSIPPKPNQAGIGLTSGALSRRFGSPI